MISNNFIRIMCEKIFASIHACNSIKVNVGNILMLTAVLLLARMVSESQVASVVSCILLAAVSAR